MTVGGVLLVYAVTVGTLGLIAFQRAAWPTRTPRLAIAVYLAGCWSALAALVLAGAALAVPTTALGGGLSDTIGACIIRLRTAYATPGGALVAGLGLAASGVLLVRLVVIAARQVVRTRRQARRQVELALMVGRRQPALGAVVVDDEHATAFCVGGGRPTVVLTSAALEVLSDDELHAVLAHERAHLAHRHHRLLTVGRRAARGVAAAAVAARRARRSWAGSSRCTPTTDAAQRLRPGAAGECPRAARDGHVVRGAAAGAGGGRNRRPGPDAPAVGPSPPPLAAANRRLAVLAARRTCPAAVAVRRHPRVRGPRSGPRHHAVGSPVPPIGAELPALQVNTPALLSVLVDMQGIPGTPDSERAALYARAGQ